MITQKITKNKKTRRAKPQKRRENPAKASFTLPQPCETLNETKFTLPQPCETLNETSFILPQPCETLNETRSILPRHCETVPETQSVLSQDCDGPPEAFLPSGSKKTGVIPEISAVQTIKKTNKKKQVMEILALHLNNLRNDAHFQFNVSAAALITEAGVEKLSIPLMFDIYQAAIAREDAVLKQIVKSDLTEKIRDADKTRDAVYSSITGVVRSLQKHHSPTVKDAAKRLKIVTDTYGNINQKSYDEQTSAVYNILQEFNGKYKNDVETIKIPEMIDELERANKAVETLMKERLDESAGKVQDTMKNARAETDEAYLAIRKRINAAVIMEGAENYAAFITKINLLINRYKTLLAKAKGKGKKADGGVNSDVDVDV